MQISVPAGLVSKNLIGALSKEPRALLWSFRVASTSTVNRKATLPKFKITTRALRPPYISSLRFHESIQVLMFRVRVPFIEQSALQYCRLGILWYKYLITDNHVYHFEIHQSEMTLFT